MLAVLFNLAKRFIFKGLLFMRGIHQGLSLAAMCLAASCFEAKAAQSVTVEMPKAAIRDEFKMGNSRRRDGQTLTLDSNSLRLNGKPWTPVMGEFHYSRVPENEWREELLKMKAGGIDIVSTYVFWIHHEEAEGQFDWSGCRNLRRFIQTAQDVGLKAWVRCGPWDHGEVRNGGFPDWLLAKGWKLRSDDTNYLEAVKVFYGEIAKQLQGLYWKDGGPIIGIQFENEFSGPAAHLMSLKRMGEEAGFDAPLYTRTGWNTPRGKMPFGELVPLYGVYAEGFWDRALTPMPSGYWKGFQFSTFRVDDATFTEVPGNGGTPDPPDADKYPYLTCEIGGGMMNSYHRRILFLPKDAEATALVKLGSGSTLLGYYMYHGGVNPEGKLSTLMESQATGYWNDMPVKNYDFQAPLGQYGQVREQYHLLRRLHLFLHEWGPELAGMPPSMPDERPHGKDDYETLRWSVRSDGYSGFVFINNYQRLANLPPKTNVQFSINLPSGPLVFPKQPIVIPSDSCLIWPFNLDLGGDIRLVWATAQPLTAIDVGNVRTVFFEQADGVRAEFAFPTNVSVEVFSGNLDRGQSVALLRGVEAGTRVAANLKLKDGGAIRIVVLDAETARGLWKAQLGGREHVFLSKANLVFDGDRLRLSSEMLNDLSVSIFPVPNSAVQNGGKVIGRADGIFQKFAVAVPKEFHPKLKLKQLREAGSLREISMGKIDRPVASAPSDADFEQAAVWSIKIPGSVNMDADPLLRIHYKGDVARVMLDGKFITDDFYNGKALEMGLRRHAPEILHGDLRIAILPLQRNAPIYMADGAWPYFGNSPAVATVPSVDIVPCYRVELFLR